MASPQDPHSLQRLGILTPNSCLRHISFTLVSSPQRWTPRGHILKSLALASRPQVLENWPVLGSRTALFFERLKQFLENVFFCGDCLKNFCEDLFFFFGGRLKNFCENLFFFLESTSACVHGPWFWPQAFLCLASRVSVLGKAILGLGLGFFCVLGLEPCVLDSTSGSPRLPM